MLFNGKDLRNIEYTTNISYLMILKIKNKYCYRFELSSLFIIISICLIIFYNLREVVTEIRNYQDNILCIKL